MIQYGDIASAIFNPFAKVLNLECIDKLTGQVKPDSTCAKVKQDLNEHRFKDAFYDRFFPKYKPPTKE